MTSLASILRSSSGFRLIWIRPLLTVVFVPSTPMNDDRLSTAGSSRISLTSACWRSAMASNETYCAASEIAEDHARVLHREEALRDDHVEEDGQRESRRRRRASVGAWWRRTTSSVVP